MNSPAPFHLIVGNGNIGQAVAAELGRRGIMHKLGSRSAAQSDTQLRVDALNLEDLIAASRGASHMYLTMGLPYVAKVWESTWPQIMRNCIEAAHVNSVRIVFFDNIYMYGPPPLANAITEDHPQNPPSRKGRVRKQIADLLLQAHSDQIVRAVIGRCADFYGPRATNSTLYVTAVSRMLAGKPPQLLFDPGIKHSYTYNIDAARGLVELALDEGAYGGVWHLPTASPTLTDTEILAKLAVLTGVASKPTVMSPTMISMLGLFIPILREVREMLYQTSTDYVFSSAKFEARYPNFKITSYDDGLKAMVDSFRTAKIN